MTIVAYAANRNMSLVTISNNLVNVPAYLDALNAVARAGKITSIALTDVQLVVWFLSVVVQTHR